MNTEGRDMPGPSGTLTSRHRQSAVGMLLVGGPTLLVEVGGLRLLTDPTFSPAAVHETTPGRPLTKTEAPAVSAAGVGVVDAVLLSHDQHADNLDPEGREFLERVPLTLTTPSAARRLRSTSVGLPPWRSHRVTGANGQHLSITAVPARHGPPGCEPLTGEVTGFVVHGADVPTVYVSGDNAALEIVEEIAGRFSVDIAVLFAGAARTSLFDGAPLTLTSEDAVEAAATLRSRWLVPVHTRGWAHFTEGPDVIRAAFDRAGMLAPVVLLEPGSHVELTVPLDAGGQQWRAR